MSRKELESNEGEYEADKGVGGEGEKAGEGNKVRTGNEEATTTNGKADKETYELSGHKGRCGRRMVDRKERGGSEAGMGKHMERINGDKRGVV